MKRVYDTLPCLRPGSSRLESDWARHVQTRTNFLYYCYTLPCGLTSFSLRIIVVVGVIYGSFLLASGLGLADHLILIFSYAYANACSCHINCPIIGSCVLFFSRGVHDGNLRGWSWLETETRPNETGIE